MKTEAWVTLVTSAIEFAVKAAKELGLPNPVASEVTVIRRAVDDAVAKLLPAEIEALGFVAREVSAHAVAKIQSLGEDERCPKCNDVLRIAVDSHGRVTSCDKCGWVSP